MHTLFALENIYGFKITNIDGEICLSLKKFDNPSYPPLFDNFTAWYAQASKLREGQISKDEYDEWRYPNNRQVVHWEQTFHFHGTKKDPTETLFSKTFSIGLNFKTTRYA